MCSVFFALALTVPATSSLAAKNEVVFDNKSGDSALVKLIGPSKQTVEVPNGGTTTVEATAGNYHILVRYGEKGGYRYSRGEEFQVEETATQRSRVTITLHKVPQGDYDTWPVDADAFNSGAVAGTKLGSADSRTESQTTTRDRVKTAITSASQMIHPEGIQNIKTFKTADALYVIFEVDGKKVYFKTGDQSFYDADKGSFLTFKPGKFSLTPAQKAHLTFYEMRLSPEATTADRQAWARKVSVSLGLPAGESVVVAEGKKIQAISYLIGGQWRVFDLGGGLVENTILQR